MNCCQGISIKIPLRLVFMLMMPIIACSNPQTTTTPTFPTNPSGPSSTPSLPTNPSEPSSTPPLTPQRMSLNQATSELRRYIEEVTLSTSYRYGAVDNRGNVMDGVKIIAGSDTSEFIGVYHSHDSSSGVPQVYLATSSDLMNWTWRAKIANQASQPTIRTAADGGYVVAWEQEPNNHLKFAYYERSTDLFRGEAVKTFDAPRQFSTCAEGTPNLFSADSVSVDVGFHYYWNCDVDRQARGIMDWSSLHAAKEEQMDSAILAHGVMGNIGDRDGIFSFRGYDFSLIEGQFTKGDFGSWRTFLYAVASGKADPLNIKTHAGSTAFANPTIESIVIDGQKAVLVTLFLPHEGALGAEAGELIYYTTYESIDLE